MSLITLMDLMTLMTLMVSLDESDGSEYAAFCWPLGGADCHKAGLRQDVPIALLRVDEIKPPLPQLVVGNGSHVGEPGAACTVLVRQPFQSTCTICRSCLIGFLKNIGYTDLKNIVYTDA